MLARTKVSGASKVWAIHYHGVVEVDQGSLATHWAMEPDLGSGRLHRPRMVASTDHERSRQHHGSSRSSAESRTFRLERAKPSDSRTVAHGTNSTGKQRSRTMA